MGVIVIFLVVFAVIAIAWVCVLIPGAARAQAEIKVRAEESFCPVCDRETVVARDCRACCDRCGWPHDTLSL